MKYGGKYWNIKTLLPYQRNFNFVNGERSLGKSYTTQGYFLERALNHGEEFVYIVRTQDEKKNNILEEAFAKVIAKEFKGYDFKFSQDEVCRVIETEEVKEYTTLGYCIALSEAAKVKKRSFPNVRWLLFDEYMLEETSSQRYVNGWKEPDLFLNIYHTIDREEDRVTCFLLGNNTSFYNPYHLHPAFQIPYIQKGGLWYSDNVLFQWAESNETLKETKSNCKFLNMIAKTDYGSYAKDGNYIDDNECFIMGRTAKARNAFNIFYMGMTFGVWVDTSAGVVFIDSKHDPSQKLYALTVKDHSENTLLTRGRTSPQLEWLARNYKLGNVRFVDMVTKVKAEGAIQLIV